MTSFLSKLNLRQLIIHFIASWLFIHAIHILATLLDFKFLYNEQVPSMSQLAVTDRYNKDLLIINQAGVVGLILAYIISYRISVKHNWFWLNSVIILIVSFPLVIFDLLGWKFFRYYFMTPGKIFDENTVPYIIVNAAVMLALGSFLFYGKGIIAYINKGVKRENDAPAPRGRKPAKA
jgi:hypothetical protein